MYFQFFLFMHDQDWTHKKNKAAQVKKNLFFLVSRLKSIVN